MPREVLGHGPRKKLKHMHIWYEPCVEDSDFLASRDDSVDGVRRGCSVPTRRATPRRRFPLSTKEGRLLAIRFMHDKKVFGGKDPVTQKLWAWLIGAARAGLIPIEKEMINLKLASYATASGYDVGLGKSCGTSSCRGGVITLRTELIEQDVIKTGKDGVEYFCEPKKDLFASEGMPDAGILELVEEVLQFREWCRVTPHAHLKLFKDVAGGAMWKRLGPDGDVLRDVLEKIKGGYRIASDVTSRIKRPPWSGIRGVLKTGPDIYAITTADVKTIAPIALDVWEWWMNERPEVGMQRRADVFKGWHHIGNQHDVDCLTIWNEDDRGELVLVDEEDAVTGDAPTAEPLDAAALDAEATTTALEIVGGFPAEFLRRATFTLSRDDRAAGWSTRGENVGDVVVMKVLVSKQGHPVKYGNTYTICVAVRREEVIGKDPFSSERKWKTEFRVVYGVERRVPGGHRLESYEDINEDKFERCRPRTPLDVATADALLKALAERRASPHLEAPALSPAQQKLKELKAEIKARDGDPSLVDGWTAVKQPCRPRDRWIFKNPSGQPFKCKDAVLKFLNLRPPKKQRVSTRVTQTIEEGRDAEQYARALSCLELRGLACKASCDCDFVAEDEDELTRHRIEVHGLSGEDAVQNPKWPCWYCRLAFDRNESRSGEVCPACQYMGGGRRKPYMLERAEDKLRIAKWRREKGLVE